MNVADVVVYHPAPGDPVTSGDQPLAAIIVGINEDGTANLVVFDRVGARFPILNVKLADGDDRPEHGFAEYPHMEAIDIAEREAVQESKKSKKKKHDWHAEGDDT